MQVRRYVVDAVVVEGRSIREVARSHGVSKSWVAVLVARYREGGYEAIEPRSKRPKRIPRRTPDSGCGCTSAFRRSAAPTASDCR